MSRKDVDLEQLVLDPRAHFSSPEEVLADGALTDADKRAVLRSWERDARELAVAEEEGMGGGERDVLQRIVDALRSLDGEPDPPGVYDKQGF